MGSSGGGTLVLEHRVVPEVPRDHDALSIFASRAVQILISDHAIRSGGRLREERRIKLPTQAANAYPLLA